VLPPLISRTLSRYLPSNRTRNKMRTTRFLTLSQPQHTLWAVAETPEKADEGLLRMFRLRNRTIRPSDVQHRLLDVDADIESGTVTATR